MVDRLDLEICTSFLGVRNCRTICKRVDVPLENTALRTSQQRERLRRFLVVGIHGCDGVREAL